MKLVLALVVVIFTGLALPALAQAPVADEGVGVVSADEVSAGIVAPADLLVAAGVPVAQRQQQVAPLANLLGKRLGLTDEDKAAIKDAVKQLREAKQALRQKLAGALRLAGAKEGKEEELRQALAEFSAAKEKMEAVQGEVDQKLRRDLKVAERPRVEAALLTLGVLDNGLGGPALQPQVGTRPLLRQRRGMRGPAMGPGFGRGRMGYLGMPPLGGWRGGRPAAGPPMFRVPRMGYEVEPWDGPTAAPGVPPATQWPQVQAGWGPPLPYPQPAFDPWGPASDLLIPNAAPQPGPTARPPVPDLVRPAGEDDLLDYLW